MPLGRKLEPELANRNHASGVQKAKTGKPAAEYLGDLLRVCLRGWVLLKLGGDTASGCPPHTTGSAKVGRRRKIEVCWKQEGKFSFLAVCPSNTPCVCVCRAELMYASCQLQKRRAHGSQLHYHRPGRGGCIWS